MNQQIEEAKIRMLLRQWPITWGGNLLIMALCCIVLWPYYSHESIILWFSSNVILFILRLKNRREFDDYVKRGPAAVKKWAFGFTVFSLLGGIIWGAAAWAFFSEEQLALTLFIFVVLVGITAGSLPPLSSYFPGFAAFSIGVTVPLAIKIETMDWEFSGWLTFMTFIYLGVSLFYSRNLSVTISDAITLDFKNIALLEEVTKAKEIAEKASIDKTSFLAAVSHDLRQPLHAMGLFLEVLNEKLQEPQQKEMFQNVESAHHALSDMFDSLLEITQLEFGAIKPVMSTFPVKPLVDSLVSEFSAECNNKGLALKASTESDVVYSDTVLLAQILRNLISNAVKYTDSGEIVIEFERSEYYLIVKISDTGHGIPRDEQKNIFSEYHQLENSARDRRKGLGLGLSIVEKITRLLDYEIQLDSELDRGTTISIRVPLGKVDDIKQTLEETSRTGLDGIHVVVIDDERDVREGMKVLLETWGCQVTLADTDKKALTLLDGKRPPDLIISDYRLEKGLIGTDVIASMRSALDPELPALLISGDTDRTILSEIKDKGFYLLYKPVKPAHLYKVMADLID